MTSITAFLRLARMRRSTGASRLQAARRAAGLLWRDFLSGFATPSPTPPVDPRRRADVERRARQRL